MLTLKTNGSRQRRGGCRQKAGKELSARPPSPLQIFFPTARHCTATPEPWIGELADRMLWIRRFRLQTGYIHT
jgi:hypothetical protein